MAAFRFAPAFYGHFSEAVAGKQHRAGYGDGGCRPLAGGQSQRLAISAGAKNWEFAMRGTFATGTMLEDYCVNLCRNDICDRCPVYFVGLTQLRVA